MLSKIITFLSVLALILPLSVNCNPVNNERNRLNAIPRPDFIENIRREVSKSDPFEQQTTNRAYYGRHYCGHQLIKALAIVCSPQDYYDSVEDERNENSVNSANQSFSSISKRAKRGVIDECCAKKCTFQDLAKYC